MWDASSSQSSRLLRLIYTLVVVGASPCHDEASCNEALKTIVERLGSTQEKMKRGKHTMYALEDLRENIVRGERIPLPSAQRQYLERGSPLVGEIAYDAKHKPLSTNGSKHMRLTRL
jgi:hypothetical protein